MFRLRLDTDPEEEHPIDAHWTETAWNDRSDRARRLRMPRLTESSFGAMMMRYLHELGRTTRGILDMRLELKRTTTLALVSAAVFVSMSSMEAAGPEQTDAGDPATDVAEPEAPAFFRLDYSGELWERPALMGD